MGTRSELQREDPVGTESGERRLSAVSSGWMEPLWKEYRDTPTMPGRRLPGLKGDSGEGEKPADTMFYAFFHVAICIAANMGI